MLEPRLQRLPRLQLLLALLSARVVRDVHRLVAAVVDCPPKRLLSKHWRVLLRVADRAVRLPRVGRGVLLQSSLRRLQKVHTLAGAVQLRRGKAEQTFLR
jgi:hypothetical protein